MHYCVCDFALDIVQNACESGAGLVGLEFGETEACVSVTVRDNGRGMDGSVRERALDPFRSGGAKHPGRKVGLGLPFLVQAVEGAHGQWSLESEPGRGTTVSFSFPKGDLDCPPVGDVPGFFLAALCLPGGTEMEISRSRKAAGGNGAGLEYRLLKSELTEVLGGLEKVSSLALLKEYLTSQETDRYE